MGGCYFFRSEGFFDSKSQLAIGIFFAEWGRRSRYDTWRPYQRLPNDVSWCAPTNLFFPSGFSDILNTHQKVPKARVVRIVG